MIFCTSVIDEMNTCSFAFWMKLFFSTQHKTDWVSNVRETNVFLFFFQHFNQRLQSFPCRKKMLGELFSPFSRFSLLTGYPPPSPFASKSRFNTVILTCITLDQKIKWADRRALKISFWLNWLWHRKVASLIGELLYSIWTCWLASSVLVLLVAKWTR